MRIAVGYQDDHLEFDIPDDRLVAHRNGPALPASGNPAAMIRESLDAPVDFPPLSLAVVPGDRVVIPFDATLPDAQILLETVAAILRQAEVESITFVADAPSPVELPEGVTWVVHDPDDKESIAYLASTKDETRVYMNRLITDADVVIPIGKLGHDPVLGYQGPWSSLYPALSERETLVRLAKLATDEVADAANFRPALVECAEVSWLLGCQFHVAVLPGFPSGTATVISGLESSVLAHGIAATDAAWSFRAPERAELVVVGVGQTGKASTIDDLAAGLATATRLARRGGKIVVLSKVQGVPGKALRRLMGVENPRSALARLRGLEAEPDYLAARRIATALSWADVYLYSGLDPQLVDDLAMIPLDRPEEARKLATTATSCILLGQGDRTQASTAEED